MGQGEGGWFGYNWRNRMARDARQIMTTEAAYQVLGLRPGATHREVQSTYRRLAMKHHPDIAGNDPASRVEFDRITRAYRTIATLDRLRARHKGMAGCCQKCGAAEKLFAGLDRKRYCAACLLESQRRYLPLPTYTVVRCISVIALQCLAIWSAIALSTTGRFGFGILGVAAALLSLIILGWIVMRADVIER